MSSLLEESYEVETPASGAPPPPIPSYQLRRDINGTETELLVQTFDDRILVLVTQTGKVGSLTQATLPPVAPLPHPPRPSSPTSTPQPTPSQNQITLPPPPDSISTTPLLGTPPDQTLHALYVSQIATLIWWTLQETASARRPVVVGLALVRSAPSGEDNEGGRDDEDGLEGGLVSDFERERFMAIMGMVVSWPGPGE